MIIILAEIQKRSHEKFTSTKNKTKRLRVTTIAITKSIDYIGSNREQSNIEKVSAPKIISHFGSLIFFR